LKLIDGQNKERWLLTTKLPLGDDNGSIIGLLGIGRDITIRKNTMEKLKLLNAELEQSLNQLQFTNRELEQFAYVASHDLQEPLRMITSFLALIERKYNPLIDEKGRQYIHFAVDGAKRMRQIILDLLEYSRTGRIEKKIELVDVNKVLEDVIQVHKKTLNTTHAEVNVSLLPVIKSNVIPLTQIFQNLIGNSLKYHKKNVAPIIEIKCAENEELWTFSVKDNGIGIASEYFTKIFIIFQRLHRKEEYSGTGIGLAITKKLVENLGGKIWVESEPQNGSTFYFTIPKIQ
jgi:light-regulated signal transduction histidine kinase (bacteriophytochrome)